MNVTFIAGHVDQSGAGSNISLDIICRHLIDHGHNVRVVTLNLDDKNTIRKETPYPITPITNISESNGEKARNLIDSLRQLSSSTDIYHVFDPFYIPLVAAYRHFGGSTPIVARLNSYTFFCTNPKMMDGQCHKECSILDRYTHDPSPLKTKALKLPHYIFSKMSIPTLANSVDSYFAQSPTVKQLYNETGIDNDRIRVLTNFYDPDFGELSLEGNEFSRDDFNCLYVGRLEKEKGVDILIDALTHTDAPVTVDIIGDGSVREDLERQTSEASLLDNIHFHGWVDHDDLPIYYAESDMFIHPARWFEPSGRALLEAMQFECPAIVSDIGGPPWIIGNAGLKYHPSSPKELAKKIDLVHSDDQLYHNLKENCSKRLEKFNPEIIIHNIEDHYEKLV